MLDILLSDQKSHDTEISYWKNKLQGVSPLLLITDFNRTSASKSDLSAIKFTIDQDLAEKLGQLAKDQDTTVFDILLSGLTVLLYRYSTTEDICVGSNLSAEIENRFALRNEATGEDVFTDLLKRVKNTTVEAQQNLNVPFEKVTSSLDKDTKSGNPFFNIFLAFNAKYAYFKSQNELSLVLNETAAGLESELNFDKSLYQESTISRMAGHYRQLLISIVNDPSKKIGALPMLTPAEEQDILGNFNDTLTYYPVEKTLVDIFEEQVAKQHAVALRQHDNTMTFAELNEKANQLAHYLIIEGAKPADNIGLITARSFDMMISMYGIMKAGGAYVPIDPEYPIDRQEYILENSRAIKVIADGNYPLRDLLPADKFTKLPELDLGKYSSENPGVKIDSKQLAYTIYTSGSTGRPKGVMIEHHSAVNLCLWVNKEYNIGSDDKLLFITSMCFDLSVYDIFGMLAAGGSIVIVKQEELMDVPKLKDMMLNYSITFWDSVPTTMDYLIRELESRDQDYIQETLKVVFMSGDWIPVNLPDRIKKFFTKTQVISLGGATEGTVWSNYFPVKDKVPADWNSIPYGRPMDNNFFYILNDQLQPQPIGIPGELYIGGVGVARGYANDDAKTNYSFVKDPFNDKALGRMYRTGDLGRMLPSLNMEFIGRKDNQVKIRGYRIELGEIESVLGQCDVVRQAVVLAKDDKDKKKRLVAYVVGKGDYSREKVIDFLKAKLPDYMVPTLWMELDELPLTSNNKIDRKSLPDFDAEEQIKDNFTAPRTETEKQMAAIWQDVLKLQRIGIDDNFFDIGGHSLLAVQITTRIEKKFDKKLQIATLFSYPTIAQLSAYIDKENTKNIKWRSIVPIKATGNKTPIYIVHGAGMNVLNFNDLAQHVDAEQPIFGVQALGLDGEAFSIESIQHVASHYVEELVNHNPGGPYAIGGYSIGGFIAVEMARQLEAMGREVKMLAIFDTDAENAREREPWHVIMPKVAKRYLPKFMGGKKSLGKQLVYVFNNKVAAIKGRLGVAKKTESDEFYALLDSIIKQYFKALESHKLEPVNHTIHLFKADFNDHYNNDELFLGWKKYTTKEVKRYPVPGNHLTMMVLPHVSDLGKALQKALNDH